MMKPQRSRWAIDICERGLTLHMAEPLDFARNVCESIQTILIWHCTLQSHWVALNRQWLKATTSIIITIITRNHKSLPTKGMIVYCCYYLDKEAGSYSAATTNALKICALEWCLALICMHVTALHTVWSRSTRRPFHSCAIQDDHSSPSGIPSWGHYLFQQQQ